MSIDVKVYDNGDHTVLVWLPSDGKPIANCRGFTIRQLKGGAETYLHGFAGFSDGDQLDPEAPWKHPLQRFMWWDYGVKPGDVVQYSVIPVVGDRSHLQLATASASPLTTPMTISSQASPDISAYFNKGIISAQWVSRALAQLGPHPDIQAIIKTPNNPLRNELSGLLRPRLLQLLADVKQSNGEIYAALYELNDPELIAGLKALGKKCHLILANGAFKPPTNDENKAVRAQLKGVVDLKNRLVTGNHFAHNKFVVACDSAGNPKSVLSGSTNWTVTGLCTQANNAIIVNDAAVAADFLAEWKLLAQAGNGYPPVLAKTNSTAKTMNLDGGTITQWFAPTNGGPDLEYARNLINAAKQGILFLFFNPGGFVQEDQPVGKWTLLQSILFRHHQDSANYNGSLYIRGVVNQEIKNLTTEQQGAGPSAAEAALDPEAKTPVTLFNGGKEPPQRLGYESMVPKNIKDVFHDWATEVLGSGVHIHSKVVVLDPFGDKPVVMTGSHNLGFKASSKNDDNLMIIEGNAPLAAAYAANIIAIYQTYRWNAYVEAHRQDPKVWHGLVDNDQWQSGYLGGDELAELQFWMGAQHAAAAGAAATANAATAATKPRVPQHVAPAPKPAAKAKPVKHAAAAHGGARRKRAAVKKPVAHKAAKSARRSRKRA